MSFSRGGLLPKPATPTIDPPFETPSSIPLGVNSGTSGLTTSGELAVIMSTAVAVVPRASATPISIPLSFPLSNINQYTSGDNSLSMAMSHFVASEVKAWKSNKEKFKAVLAVIDIMDDEELSEVGSVPKPSQVPSLQTNLGTFDSSLLLFSDSLLNSPENYSSNNGS